MPSGIPRPSFGLTNSFWIYHPDLGSKTWNYGSGAVPYRTNSYGPFTHYIDKSHPSATDTANTYGTEATPRLTIPYPLSAGSCVQVHGGAYGSAYNFSNSGANMAFGGNGTESDPIFIYGVTTNVASLSWFRGNGSPATIYNWGNWMIVENIGFTNSTGFNTRPILRGAPVTNSVVRDCYFWGTGVNGQPVCVSVGGSSGSSSTAYTRDLVVFGHVMREYGDWNYATQNDACGAIFSQNTTNAWLFDCEIYHMGGDGLRLGADQGDAPSGQRYFVGRNHIHHNRENGIDVKQARFSVISDNDMHDFEDRDSSGGEAIVIHYDPEETWIINNRIYNCLPGIYVSGIGTNAWIIGNVLYNCSTRAMYPDRGGGSFYIYGNTIADCNEGIICSGSVDKLVLRNNCITGTTNSDLQISDSVVRAASSAQGENYYGTVSINWGSTYTSVSAWDSALATVSSVISSDPLFVDATTRDYRLTASSPNMDSGVTMDVETGFSAAFGFSLGWVDPSGNTRPMSGAYDIGAYEYGTLVNAPAAGRRLGVSVGGSGL